MHNFAQIFSENVVDGENGEDYLAHQIEPEAKWVHGSVQKSRSLKRFRDSERDCDTQRLHDSAVAAAAPNGADEAGLKREGSSRRAQFKTGDGLTAVETLAALGTRRLNGAEWRLRRLNGFCSVRLDREARGRFGSERELWRPHGCRSHR